MNELVNVLIARSRSLLPQEGALAINRRHRRMLEECTANLLDAKATSDPLISSEALRLARMSLDRITGRAGVEEMLDALFGRFCIGK
jgi:tRNA modification GTPase